MLPWAVDDRIITHLEFRDVAQIPDAIDLYMGYLLLSSMISPLLALQSLVTRE